MHLSNEECTFLGLMALRELKIVLLASVVSCLNELIQGITVDKLLTTTGKMRTCGSVDFLDLKMTKPNYKSNTGPNSNPNANPNTKQTSLNLSPQFSPEPVPKSADPHVRTSAFYQWPLLTPPFRYNATMNDQSTRVAGTRDIIFTAGSRPAKILGTSK